MSNVIRRRQRCKKTWRCGAAALRVYRSVSDIVFDDGRQRQYLVLAQPVSTVVCSYHVSVAEIFVGHGRSCPWIQGFTPASHGQSDRVVITKTVKHCILFPYAVSCFGCDENTCNAYMQFWTPWTPLNKKFLATTLA